jgi:hypothetical protein
MEKQVHKQPAHVVSATFAIALMAIALAAGLDFLKIIDRLDRWIVAVFLKPGLSAPVHALEPVVLWGGTVLLALGLSAVMLNVSGAWRRLLVWAFALVITFFWVPVLLLASHQPEIGVAVVAILWSGCCSMVYTMNHAMPADLTDFKPTSKNDGTH